MPQNKKSVFYFSPQERTDLIISWVTLSIAFAIMILPIITGNQFDPFFSLPVAFVAVGTGFVFHELAHREAAKHYGFHSEFRAWYPGLALAIGLAIITWGALIFAAPGATYYFANNPTKRQDGVISIVGPVTNIIIGIFLLFLAALAGDKFLFLVFLVCAKINFGLALFNMIPIFPLDGSKVIQWKSEYWFLVTAIAAILVFFPEVIFGFLGI